MHIACQSSLPCRRKQERDRESNHTFRISLIQNSSGAQIETKQTIVVVKDFGELFSVVAGQPQRTEEHCPKGSSCRYRARRDFSY